MSSFPPYPIQGAASTRHVCPHCGATFNSAGALRDHKKQKLEQENKEDMFLTHVYCSLCDLDFGSRDAGKIHWNQYHAQQQNLDCPGCSAHFVKFSSFVQHIELNLCPKISQETAAAADRCKMSLDFVKGLEERDRESGKLFRLKDFSRFLGAEQEPAERVSWTGTPSHPWDNQSAEGWGAPDFDASERSEFPRMSHREYHHGNTNIPDLLTGDDNDRLDENQGDNPWASKKNLFPNASPAQRPTSEQLDQLLVDHQSLAVTRACNNFRFDTDDPNSPQFSADKYLNPYTKKYQCPKCRSGKSSYNTKSALIQHLRSAAHKFEKEVCCPSCLSTFKSLHALAAHCEAESKKCNFRYSDMYGMFLQQLTWNLVEVTGEHKEDGTAKYGITQRAKEDYGVVKPDQPQPTFGHQQVYGFEPSTPRLKQGELPQHVGHQHEQVMRASGAPRQSIQNAHPERTYHSGYSQGPTLQDAECFKTFFVDGSSRDAQQKQQQKQADGASWQTAQAEGPQIRKQSQAPQQQQQQRRPLTAEALSKFNLQQAKNARFQLEDKRENESTAWSQGPGSWGSGNDSDSDDGYQGW